MQIRPGDLLHADRHGVLSVPAEIADRIPPVATEIKERRHRIVDTCRCSDFSIEKLGECFQKEIDKQQANRRT
jgi:regulator of RNase E activity RraA